MATRSASSIEAIKAAALPLRGDASDFEPLLRRVDGARIVLIGEASHGTHEFYRVRAEITKRLIRDKGFSAVAVEADWPDAYRVNRFVRGRGNDTDSTDALGGFRRFPQWMWRNADVLDFVGWLRAHNESVGAHDQVGFYGLDLYSLHASMEAVLAYLRTVDPDAARRAQARYACFDHVGPDLHRYGAAARFGLTPSCEREVVAQLMELQRSAGEYAKRDGRLDPDALFYAEQNARVVRNGEAYYRAAVSGGPESWNLRDTHMAETLAQLTEHLGRANHDAPKIVVWAHNSHLGDATWTELGTSGELNVGQLVRERHPQDSVLIGFTTYSGSVTAASDWDAPSERKRVRPALPGSYESLFHDAGIGNFLLLFDHGHGLAWALDEPRLERAIGVIYRPETERASHYFNASISRQFDAVLHYDVTRAVEPLERNALWDRGELPETFPSSL